MPFSDSDKSFIRFLSKFGAACLLFILSACQQPTGGPVQMAFPTATPGPLPTETPTVSAPNSPIAAPTPTADSESLSYISEAGQFSLQYPAQYNLYENAKPSVDGVLAEITDSISLHYVSKNSGLSSFILSIQYEPRPTDQTLTEIAEQLCPVQEKEPQSLTIAGQEALLVEDTVCGPSTISFIVFMSDQYLYRISIENNGRFADIEEDVMAVLATFEITSTD